MFENGPDYSCAIGCDFWEVGKFGVGASSVMKWKNSASVKYDVESRQGFHLDKFVKAVNKDGRKYKEIIKTFPMAYVYEPVKLMGIEIEYIPKVTDRLPHYLWAYTKLNDSCRV